MPVTDILVELWNVIVTGIPGVIAAIIVSLTGLFFYSVPAAVLLALFKLTPAKKIDLLELKFLKYNFPLSLWIPLLVPLFILLRFVTEAVRLLGVQGLPALFQSVLLDLVMVYALIAAIVVISTFYQRNTT